jgi:hypothetical protein
MYLLDAGGVAICQLSLGGLESNGQLEGGLISRLSNLSNTQLPQDEEERQKASGFITRGFPYLVIDTTPHDIAENSSVNQTSDSKQDRPWAFASLPNPNLQGHLFLMNLSLCYTALDTARLDIELYGNKDRVEPVLCWDPIKSFFTTPDLLEQMGVGHYRSTESRGILDAVCVG